MNPFINAKLDELREQLLHETEFPTGTVRHWDDGDYQKQADGSWKPVPSKTAHGAASAPSGSAKKAKKGSGGGGKGGGGGDDEDGEKETHPHDTSFHSFAVEHEKNFLAHVGQGLKKAFGTKLSKVVAKKGKAAAWLELEGEDASDHSFQLQVTLNHHSPTDVDVHIWGTHAYKGDIDEKRSLKTGQLTPNTVTKTISQMMQMK